jgi:hypothetical protein
LLDVELGWLEQQQYLGAQVQLVLIGLLKSCTAFEAYTKVYSADLWLHSDPLTVLRTLNTQLNAIFEYTPAATRVDSPIDEAIRQRSGVCQDYAHVMLALVRTYLRIPCRYVSGYLYHRQDDQSTADATHAWVEAWLPELGWVGFDPTNNLLAGERHIRAAVGRDYRDVPPTRGVFKGVAASELAVSVQVRKADDPTEDASQAGELLLLGAPVAVSPILANIQQQQQ